jgi:hypothetical protein
MLCRINVNFKVNMKRIVTALVVLLCLISMASAITVQDIKTAHDNRGGMCTSACNAAAVKLGDQVIKSWIKANPGTGDITRCYMTNKGRKVKAITAMSTEQGNKGQWNFVFKTSGTHGSINPIDDYLLIGHLGYMDKRPYKAWLVPDSVLNQHEAIEGSGVMHDHKNYDYLSVSILNPPAWLSSYEY